MFIYTINSKNKPKPLLLSNRLDRIVTRDNEMRLIDLFRGILRCKVMTLTLKTAA